MTMPDLHDDLRTYFDQLADRAQLNLPELAPPLPQPPADDRRTGRRSRLALVAAIAIVTITIAVGVAVAHRSTTAPLDVGGPTTEIPPAASGGRWGLTVDPVTDLSDGQVVQVHAGGFVPGHMVGIVMCDAASLDPGHGFADCDLETMDQVPPDAQGAIDRGYALRRIIRTSQGAYDCGTEPRGCAVMVGPSADTVGSAPGDGLRVSFGPGRAAPLPAITMTPSSDLRDGTVVEIAGTGFAPGSEVWVAECPPATDCIYPAFGIKIQPDADGSFHQPLTLHRTFTKPTDGSIGTNPPTWDCTSGCSVIAATISVSAQLSADPLPFVLAGP